MTVAPVRGGGLAEGQWVDIYRVTGFMGSDAAFTYIMIFSNETGLMKVPVAGVLNLVTGHYTLSGSVKQGTGRYGGATGTWRGTPGHPS